MGSSSNFGNMFSMAGAALFLPFLPMLPIQVLLNNLLYDISRDHDFVRSRGRGGHGAADTLGHAIDRTIHAGLRAGQLGVRFPDLLCPDRLFGAGETLFHTGWFIESLATQVLVVFAIRTRRRLFHSWPHPALGYLAVGIVLLGGGLPYTPLASWFGFVPPPLSFFAYLIIAVAAYLGLVDLIKHAFYRHLTRRQTRWRRLRQRL